MNEFDDVRDEILELLEAVEELELEEDEELDEDEEAVLDEARRILRRRVRKGGRTKTGARGVSASVGGRMGSFVRTQRTSAKERSAGRMYRRKHRAQIARKEKVRAALAARNPALREDVEDAMGSVIERLSDLVSQLEESYYQDGDE